MMTGHVKVAVIGADILAGLAVAGSLVGYLPIIASVVATLYYMVMIYIALTTRKRDD